MKSEVNITNWSIGDSCNNPYLAPELRQLVLHGDVINHPMLGTCKGLLSSSLIELDLKARRVETQNTIYLLEGPPDEKWVEFLKSINYDMSKLPDGV